MAVEVGMVVAVEVGMVVAMVLRVTARVLVLMPMSMSVPVPTTLLVAPMFLLPASQGPVSRVWVLLELLVVVVAALWRTSEVAGRCEPRGTEPTRSTKNWRPNAWAFIQARVCRSCRHLCHRRANSVNFLVGRRRKAMAPVASVAAAPGLVQVATPIARARTSPCQQLVPAPALALALALSVRIVGLAVATLVVVLAAPRFRQEYGCFAPHYILWRRLLRHHWPSTVRKVSGFVVRIPLVEL